MTDKLTPFQAAGYTEDDIFEFIGECDEFSLGTRLILSHDDNSSRPRFSKPDGSSDMWLRLDEIKLIPREVKSNLTPFQEAGYTEDDIFEYISDDDEWPYGTLIKLAHDDSTIMPEFVDLDGNETWYALIDGDIRKVEPLSKIAIPSPATLADFYLKRVTTLQGQIDELEAEKANATSNLQNRLRVSFPTACLIPVN